MAAQDAEEFDFSDGDLDGLDDTTFRELEKRAILSTQQQTTTISRVQGISNAPPAARTAARGHARPYAANGPARPPSSDYGFEDEEVIDLNEQPNPLPERRGENNFQHGYGNNQVRAMSRPAQRAQPHHTHDTSRGEGGLQGNQQESVSTVTLQGSMGGELDSFSTVGNQSQIDAAPSQGNISVAALLARIKELEKDRVKLRRSFHEAQTTVQSQRGEIAIVRSKFEKSEREHELQMNRMKQLHDQQITRQKVDLEQAHKDKETAETNSRFLEHEVAQERGRARTARKTLKDGGSLISKTVPTSPAVTPKKARQLPFRDGFDDDDILMVSPSKVKDRSKPSTPKAGSKRKRAATEHSPSLALPLSEPRRTLKPEESGDSGLTSLDAERLGKFRRDDKRFEFLRRFLNYRRQTPQGRERVLESLAQFRYPSTPNQTLASVMYDGISSISEACYEEYPLKFIQVLIGIWEGCLRERYYGPISLLLDSLDFLLAYEPLSTTAALAEIFVPSLQATIDLVSLPIARAATNSTFVRDRDSPSQRQINKDIDVYRLLSLLHDISLSCVNTSEESITRFWQLMQHDFALLLLMKAQDLEFSITMLRILATSALETSIGAVVANSTTEQQVKRETLLLDRLANLLFDKPGARKDQKPYDGEDISALRMEVLSVLSSFSLTPYGGEVLSRHRILLGSLIRFLDSSITALYDYSPCLQPPLANSINLTMRLIYHLVKTYPQVADLRVKTGAVHGGQHKHLVAFTRLAFSEGLLLEKGIVEEVMDMAQELLESALTPEEAEQVENVFSTGRSVV